MSGRVGIAVVGCGYVADSYRHCFALHERALRIVGVFDRDADRLAKFTACWGDRAYASLDAVMRDDDVQIVVNLTDPENHAAVTRAAFDAGKHVYSEKPLALTTQEAMALRDHAREAGVRFASAPCNSLGESAQTAWAAVRAGKIGPVRLVYAELDDGMIHRANYQTWISKSGRAWPARGEFETGCTFEHAGYALMILTAMLGPVRRVTSFSAEIIADKKVTPALHTRTPDFSVGMLEFDNGVVARVTNSIVAPYDHRMRLIGDEGCIEIRELWDYASQVVLRPVAQGRFARLMERHLGRGPGRTLRPVRKPPIGGRAHHVRMDFMRGVAELADAIVSGRASRLDEDLAVHITEVTEMLQHPDRFSRPALVQSTFAPIAPMDWAC